MAGAAADRNPDRAVPLFYTIGNSISYRIKTSGGSHCGGKEDVAYAPRRWRRIPQAGFFFIKFLATAQNMVYSGSRLLVLWRFRAAKEEPFQTVPPAAKKQAGDIRGNYGKISCNSGITCKSEDDQKISGTEL
ncbi:MAG TPA: hypothetical protein H9700_01430 [Candidatus Eisenbergiella intestinipullorum]|nr:hypothetical protein [Candidatus Eisenbergiella intestinipullorum]